MPADRKTAYEVGDVSTLHYRVEWRLIRAGNARLVWGPSPGESHPGWLAKAFVESTGLVSKLFKVEDRYSVLLDPQFCASQSEMSVHEGSRRRQIRMSIDRRRKRALYVERDAVSGAVVASADADVGACVHDVLGALARLRTLRLEPGQSAEFPMTDGRKAASVRVAAERREEIDIGDEIHRTIRYEAFLFNNVLYRRQGSLHVWITDDERRLPVQIQIRLQLHIGTITLQLEKEETT